MVLQYCGYGFRVRRCAAPRNDDCGVAGADHMQALRFLFSPFGRLRPRPFAWAALAVYVAGLAAQSLTASDMLARIGLWPFAIAQVVLIWMWFALHAKRLRDAGHAIGLAVGASVLYALSIVLLLIIGGSFLDKASIDAANGSSALGLLVLISTIATLLSASHYDVTWLFVAGLTIMAFLPPLVALAVTLWAATRPSGHEA
jgi:uncharacterized membrane protein YhaH (DUF805 family)